MSKPVAALPNGITQSGDAYVGTVLDTAYTAPTGRDWPCHTAQEFRDALKDSIPGDCILLDPGVVYSGNFVIPAKADNGEWLHITTKGFHDLHPEGTRICPGDAIDMAVITSPSVSQVLALMSGTPNTNHVRVYGVTLTSTSNYTPSGYTPGVWYGYAMVAVYGAWSDFDYDNPPSDIIFDRVYIHGDDTHDLQAGIQCNFARFALVDSHISDIHMKGTDTTACGGATTPGPIKIVNNFLAAAGENIIFGGGGGNVDPVTSDIEIRENYLFKPLEWVPLSSAPVNQYVVKNSFELKNAARVLFDRNVIENCWYGGQMGYCVVLTVRTSQSGDTAVVNDVTITNNLCKNVVSFVNAGGTDDLCANSSYPNCKCAGSQARWNISNNLVIHYDPRTSTPGGNRNALFAMNGGMDRVNNIMGTVRDVVFQHNTQVPHPSTPNVWGGVWMSMQAPPSGFTRPEAPGDNIWILDNVMGKQLTGDNGYVGSKALQTYLGESDPYDEFQGNVMLRQGAKPPDWPASNTMPDTITFVDPANGDYTLLAPVHMETSDDELAGVDMTLLPGSPAPEPPEPEPGPEPPEHEPRPPKPTGIAFQLDCHTAVNPKGQPVVSVTVIKDSVHYE